MSSSLLREEDNQELRSIFDAFDHNSDGLLDVDEVAAILHSFGKPMTEAEVRRSLRPAPGAWTAARECTGSMACAVVVAGARHGDGAQARAQEAPLRGLCERHVQAHGQRGGAQGGGQRGLRPLRGRRQHRHHGGEPTGGHELARPSRIQAPGVCAPAPPAHA
eukprot:scaffold4746_cov57-Phaeocystis_antarctica.AAC.1